MFPRITIARATGAALLTLLVGLSAPAFAAQQTGTPSTGSTTSTTTARHGSAHARRARRHTSSSTTHRTTHRSTTARHRTAKRPAQPATPANP
jgi:hypothetical protein